jgi:hypothetical protein
LRRIPPQTEVDRATPEAYNGAVFTFIESAAFERVRAVYLDDDECAELQQFMMHNPEAGKVVRGSGCVRKLRWGAKAQASVAVCV